VTEVGDGDAHPPASGLGRNGLRRTQRTEAVLGYEAHDKNRVRLYLSESFTFRVLEHAVAVYLRP
jgi:hypothetical protein